MMPANNKELRKQLTALHEYIEGVLGEECSVCVYNDGSLIIETPVTPEKNGRGFGFDSIEEMERDLLRHKQ